MDYVLGFAYSLDRNNLVLIKKKKPLWQEGFLNGIGGKIEEYDKNSLSCMIREFKEETGVNIQEWYHFCDLNFEHANVKCFKTFNDKIFECITTEEEEIEIVNVDDINNLKLIENLNYLIPLSLNDSIKFINLFY